MNSPLPTLVSLRRVVATGLSVLAFTTTAVCQIVLNTTTSSEGLAYRDFSFSPGSTSILSADATYSVTYDASTFGKYTTMPVFNFPLVSLAGQAITSATLHLYTGGTPSTAVYTVNDYSAAANTSGSGTASYAQSTNGTLLLDITGHAAGWLTIDVTSSISNALSHGWSWIAYNVRVSYPTSGLSSTGTIAGIYSANAPSITVTAVPEPSTWATLAGLVALSVVAIRRRQTHRS